MSNFITLSSYSRSPLTYNMQPPLQQQEPDLEPPTKKQRISASNEQQLEIEALTLSNMPKSIFTRILRHLSNQDILQIRLLSKYWNSITINTIAQQKLTESIKLKNLIGVFDLESSEKLNGKICEFSTLINSNSVNNFSNIKVFLKEVAIFTALKVKNAEFVNIVTHPIFLMSMTDSNLFKLVSDPETLKILTNPELLKIATNPEVLKMEIDPNILATIANPVLLKLVNNSEFLRIMTNPESVKKLMDPETLKGLNAKALNWPVHLEGYISLRSIQEQKNSPKHRGYTTIQESLHFRNSFLELSPEFINKGDIEGALLSILKAYNYDLRSDCVKEIDKTFKTHFYNFLAKERNPDINECKKTYYDQIREFINQKFITCWPVITGFLLFATSDLYDCIDNILNTSISIIKDLDIEHEIKDNILKSIILLNRNISDISENQIHEAFSGISDIDIRDQAYKDIIFNEITSKLFFRKLNNFANKITNEETKDATLKKIALVYASRPEIDLIEIQYVIFNLSDGNKDRVSEDVIGQILEERNGLNRQAYAEIESMIYTISNKKIQKSCLQILILKLAKNDKHKACLRLINSHSNNRFKNSMRREVAQYYMRSDIPRAIEIANSIESNPKHKDHTFRILSNLATDPVVKVNLRNRIVDENIKKSITQMST